MQISSIEVQTFNPVNRSIHYLLNIDVINAAILVVVVVRREKSFQTWHRCSGTPSVQ